MKKILSICLVAVLSLSLVACGSKKEEKKSDFEKAQAEISDAITPLAQSPEPEKPAKPEKEVFTCKDEMYGYALEDGIIQVDDIIFDTLESKSLMDALAPFFEKGDRYTYKMKLDQTYIEYNEEGLVENKKQVHVMIHKGGRELIAISGINRTGDMGRVTDCTYCDFYIPEESQTALDSIWYGEGLCANGDGINYDNVFTTVFDGLEKGSRFGLNEYDLLAAPSHFLIYEGRLVSPRTFSSGGDDREVYFKLEVEIDKSDNSCTHFLIDKGYVDK